MYFLEISETLRKVVSQKFLLQLMKTQDCHSCMTKNLKEDLPACNIKQGETFDSSHNLENKTIYKS